jgi:hypothetical protein
VIEEGDHDALIRLEGGVYRRMFERQALELAKGLIEQTGGYGIAALGSLDAAESMDAVDAAGDARHVQGTAFGTS